MKTDLIMIQREEVEKLEKQLKQSSEDLVRLENEYAKTFQAGELVFFQPEDEEKSVKFLITGINYVYYLDNPQYVITGLFQDGRNNNNPFEVRDITALVKFEDSTF